MSAADAGSARRGLLDACTLAPIRLRSTLLWLAEAGLFEVLWSSAGVDNVAHNAPRART